MRTKKPVAETKVTTPDGSTKQKKPDAATKTKKLDSSIPANNEKIIEIYHKIKSGNLDPSPEFQRKLVWKKQHKIKFIETILKNYPFPEIYVAPGHLDVASLKLKDMIVDGQQRLDAIVSFIDNTGVFALENIHPKFSDLDDDQKGDFLNYEVSVRYLKNAKTEQIKEIFQRINNTEYALNKIERINAQWGDSEFICFAKQIIEKKIDIDKYYIDYIVPERDRNIFVEFFHETYDIFSESDISRMYSLQYALALIATILEKSYFRRNEQVQKYIQDYNDSFPEAEEIKDRLLEVVKFIKSLGFDNKSYWLNKANIFTLIVELYKYDLCNISVTKLKEDLIRIESIYKNEISADKKELSILDKYFSYAKEAVNEKTARDYRGKLIGSIIESNVK